jgi:hypothetical protein
MIDKAILRVASGAEAWIETGPRRIPSPPLPSRLPLGRRGNGAASRPCRCGRALLEMAPQRAEIAGAAAGAAWKFSGAAPSFPGTARAAAGAAWKVSGAARAAPVCCHPRPTPPAPRPTPPLPRPARQDIFRPRHGPRRSPPAKFRPRHVPRRLPLAKFRRRRLRRRAPLAKFRRRTAPRRARTGKFRAPATAWRLRPARRRLSAARSSPIPPHLRYTPNHRRTRVLHPAVKRGRQRLRL